MKAFATRSVAPAAWLAAIAAVLALIGWETDWGRQLVRAPAVPAATTPVPVELALLPDYRVEGGLEARPQTVERPVFVPTRRPAPPPVPVAQEAAKPRMQKGQFVLTGTAVVEQKSVAFLREAAGGKARSVRVGETINGLLVAEVKPDRVRLTLGDDSEELVLAVAKGPRTTVQPTPAGALGAPLPGQPGGPPAGAGPVAGAAPATGAPGQPGGAQPGAADAEASLLERRRAARAAQAAAESAARAGQATPSVLPATPGATSPAPATTATPAAPDPAWAEVYRRMQQPRR
jgi:hypothetical protein